MSYLIENITEELFKLQPHVSKKRQHYVVWAHKYYLILVNQTHCKGWVKIQKLIH